MTKILIKFEANWADEMDICGWAIEDAVEWKKVKEDFQKKYAKKGFNFYIGTNEDLEYSNAKDLFRNITEKEITDEVAIIIEKIFGTNKMTNPVDIMDKMIGLLNDDDDDENEEDEENTENDM